MFKKLLLIILTTLPINSYANKVAIVDVEKVIASSVAAKKASEELNEIMKSYQLEIDNRSKSLKDEHNKLQEQAKVLTKDAIKTEQEKIYQKLKTLEVEVENKKKALQSSYIDSVNKIEAKILEIVNQTAKSQKINLVFTKDNLIFYQDITDISDIVIEKLNKQLPKLNLGIND